MEFALVRRAAQQLAGSLSTRVFGIDQVIEQVIVCVLAKGHALLTGAPGVAKTTLVRNLASALNCGYNRIQFTPDLTPFDIIGGETIAFDPVHPELKRIIFQSGPVFTPFLLADEINRASPRTQSALLEAMQERQVTVAGESRILPQPFYVFATQNPIENEGTFPLPEAQLDRFLLDIDVPFPDFAAELRVARLPQRVDDLPPLEMPEILFSARRLIEQVNVPKTLFEGMIRLVRSTRPEDSNIAAVRRYVSFGASPRASQALLIASQAYAVLKGDNEVSEAHVRAMAAPVLRHRIVANFQAATERMSNDLIIKEVLAETIL